MIQTRADLRLALTGLRNGTPLEGGLVGEVLRDLSFFHGNTAAGERAINRMIYRENLTVPQAGSETIDLTLEPAPPDAQADIEVVKVVYFRAAKANAGNIVFDPTVLEGWNTVFAGTVQLAPGGEFLWILPSTAPNVVVDASDLITFTNALAQDLTLEKVLILGSAAV